MLVLTRKSNQSIMIGDDIEVSVLSIMGEKVRIGIQAPRDIPVFRREVYLEIQEERRANGAGRGPAVVGVAGGLRRQGPQPITRYSVSNITTVTSTAVATSTRQSRKKRAEPSLWARAGGRASAREATGAAARPAARGRLGLLVERPASSCARLVRRAAMHVRG
jgi:carbon storage regulator